MQRAALTLAATGLLATALTKKTGFQALPLRAAFCMMP